MMFVIITDGEKNPSLEYSAEKIKAQIERQKTKCGWEFIFLGANIDAVETAGRFIHSDAQFCKLCKEHLPALKTIPGWLIPHWPPQKSIHTHTVLREKGVRILLRFLWPYSYIPEFFGHFFSTLGVTKY